MPTAHPASTVTKWYGQKGQTLRKPALTGVCPYPVALALDLCSSDFGAAAPWSPSAHTGVVGFLEFLHLLSLHPELMAAADIVPQVSRNREQLESSNYLNLLLLLALDGDKTPLYHQVLFLLLIRLPLGGNQSRLLTQAILGHQILDLTSEGSIKSFP